MMIRETNSLSTPVKEAEGKVGCLKATCYLQDIVPLVTKRRIALFLFRKAFLNRLRIRDRSVWEIYKKIIRLRIGFVVAALPDQL